MENSTPQVKSQSSKVSSGSQPINENHINVSFPLQQFQQEKQGEVKAITLESQPIRIHVDAPTDWPPILISAVVAVSVGLMAYFGQINQVRASRANFRHEWQQEFKQNVGRFIAAAAGINILLKQDDDCLNNDDFRLLFCDFVEYQVRIELMLDRSKSYSGQLVDRVDKFAVAVLSRNSEEVEKLLKEFIDMSNGIVEKVWQDMRGDLDGSSKRWWRSIFSG